MRFLGLFFLCASLSLPSSGAFGEALELFTVERRLNVEDRQQTRVGDLVWRGGIELRSDRDDFGGLSGLLVSSDGREFAAVTDQGRWFSALLDYDPDGFLEGLSKPEIGRLHGSDGQALDSKFFQDAESLAILPDGSILVSFEHDHRILLYPSKGSDASLASPLANRPEIWPLSDKMADLPDNDGMEALVELDQGRLLVVSAVEDDNGDYEGYLWDGGEWQTLTLGKSGDYKPTGAAWLPGEDIFLLERQFSLLGGVGVRLRRIPLDQVQANSRLVGTEVAEIKPPLIIDNFEGIALHRNAQGELLVTLLSDDNFSFLQRSLLLMFAVDPPQQSAPLDEADPSG
ncbi:MAG: esterase-like activity of phytase family protein [Pseudomonadota bacterium]